MLGVETTSETSTHSARSHNTQHTTHTRWPNAVVTDRAPRHRHITKLIIIISQQPADSSIRQQMDVSCISGGRVRFSACTFTSVKRHLIRQEDRWACCLIVTLWWCQQEDEMISSCKLSPCGNFDPDEEVVTETDPSSGSSVGWSSLNGGLNDLTLHDGGSCRWDVASQLNPFWLDVCYRPDPGMTLDGLQSWHWRYFAI